jgi:mannitol/fructose-specific phosphotransferase system IIA component (Ntr-type)
MSIERCFEEGTVVPDLESTEKYDAIRELIRRAPVFRDLADLDAFELSVIEREQLETTAFGHGVAVAHGRVDGLARVLIGLGLAQRGIPFDSPDGAPVRLLFVIASPPHMSREYLYALSTLVRVIRDRTVREALLAAGAAREVETRIHDAISRCLELRLRLAAAAPSCGCQPSSAAR